MKNMVFRRLLLSFMLLMMQHNLLAEEVVPEPEVKHEKELKPAIENISETEAKKEAEVESELVSSPEIKKEHKTNQVNEIKIEQAVMPEAGAVASAVIEAEIEIKPVPIEDTLTKYTNKINELVKLGVPGLALRFVDSKQPALEMNNLSEWLWWEQKRIQLLQRLQHWLNIIDRINAQKVLWASGEVAAYDKNWFLTQRVKAHQKLNHHSQALSQLQSLIWHIDAYVDSDTISSWRRLIIRSYMNMKKIEDAQRAMRRYLQDYGSASNSNDTQWKLLQAQLLMRTGRYQEIIQLLQSAENIEEENLLLVAKIKAHVISAESVILQTSEKLLDENISEDHRSVYHYALLLSSIENGNLRLQIEALEDLLSRADLSYLQSVFSDVNKHVDVDKLWQAYQDYGFQKANQDNLLRGDDEAWYLKAGNLFEGNSLYAKILYVVLAFNAQQQHHKNIAFQQFIALLEKDKVDLELVNKLFMQSKRISNIELIPAAVRYRLVDYALSHADLKTAATLMEKLQQAPEGETAFDWGLRRARILILGGQYKEGFQVLNSLAKADIEITELQIDQYMQVVFDLQNIKQHDLALSAFAKLDQYPQDAKLQREMAYWKAESYQAKGEYEQAAYLYLKSAKPLDDTYDPWYHTASFKAAESLAEAKLIDDARKRYVWLLKITANAARKAVIRQRLQQLRLLQNVGAPSGVQ
jgi:hypothetical protein